MAQGPVRCWFARVALRWRQLLIKCSAWAGALPQCRQALACRAVLAGAGLPSPDGVGCLWSYWTYQWAKLPRHQS